MRGSEEDLGQQRFSALPSWDLERRRKAEADGLRIGAPSAKRPYSPRQSGRFKASGVVTGERSQFTAAGDAMGLRPTMHAGSPSDKYFPVDSSARSYSTFDCSSGGLCSSAYQLAGCQQDGGQRSIQGYEKGTIRLDFDDFCCLMKLKIGY